jgi:hypothetical protein
LLHKKLWRANPASGSGEEHRLLSGVSSGLEALSNARNGST